jgi:hypothetical protein
MRDRDRRVLAAVVLLVTPWALVRCVGSVRLRHPTTTQEAKVRPLRLHVGSHGVDNLNRCLDDYQRQGYERVP